MNRTHVWTLAAVGVVVAAGIIVSLMYLRSTSPGNIVGEDITPTVGMPFGSSTVKIGDSLDTILTPSTRFPAGMGTTSIDIPRIDFSFVSPKAGDTYTTGDTATLSIVLKDPNQQLATLGFELYRADTGKFVATSSMPSIAAAGDGSLSPMVSWTIPKDLPQGNYHILAYVNRTPYPVQSGTFEIVKNPITIIASANNQFGSVPARDRGESVELVWRTTGATSCTTGLSSDLERNLPANGRKTVFVQVGDSLVVSCSAGSASAIERIKVIKK